MIIYSTVGKYFVVHSIKYKSGSFMERICAWCQKQLEPFSNGDATKTHGICQLCQDELLGVKRHRFNDFLDTINKPLLVVDDDGMILTGNKASQDMLGKILPDIEGLPGGIVFECINANLPGGCGHTIHCVGCTVRQTVMSTFDTGQPIVKASALLETHTGDIDFHISTIPVNGYVILRIDAVNPDS